ncbi:MAG: helix-turn-helix transcriptional regulator [Clostridia bacterium]|jgi:transcriptional regulator with XRE-family HTH domain|nr:helix-turn-helix transcriptional regulator [Clostridia bacterium]
MDFVLYERIKKVRLENGLTQQQVAQALGLNSVTYLRYEKGQRQMPLELLPKLADLFDVTLDYLFGRTSF